MFEWDWQRAEESLKRGIALDPVVTWAYYMYVQHLTAQGRFDEAIEQVLEAQRLDPVSISPISTVDLGMLYARKGDLEKAARAWQEALELAPNDYRTYRQLGNFQCLSGNVEEGIQMLQRSSELLPGEERVWSDLGFCHALAGDREEAAEFLQRIEASAEVRYVDPVHFALIHVALDEPDRAFEWLQRGYEIHAAMMFEVATDPRYEPLHSDPRFEALVSGMGLEAVLPPPRG